MKSFIQTKPGVLLGGAVKLALALVMAAPSAHANVYASNIKINGELLAAQAEQGQNVNISYILNEPASDGVTINILSNAVVIRTLNVAGGEAGALRGANTVVWDGKDAGGNFVGLGADYSVSITAASTGYASWTTTTDDSEPLSRMGRPRHRREPESQEPLLWADYCLQFLQWSKSIRPRL